jgi:hypothetical protein
MSSKDNVIYEAHRSKTTKYYGLLFVLIIAIPIGLFLYLSLEGPIFFTVFMFSILLGLLVTMAYSTLASGSLRYELSNKALRVSFGLFNKTIAYSRISSAERVQLTLSLRLFGASLPGFHWGLYRTSIGNAHVYGTRISGDFIVVTMLNGERIAVSPEEPERFLNALNEKKTHFGGIEPTQISSQERSFDRFVYAQIFVVAAAYCVFLGYFFWVYASLPQIVPVHFGFDGVANRWADKSELLWLAGIAAALPIINAILSAKFGKYERELLFLLGIIFVASAALFFYALNMISISA